GGRGLRPDHRDGAFRRVQRDAADRGLSRGHVRDLVPERPHPEPQCAKGGDGGAVTGLSRKQVLLGLAATLAFARDAEARSRWLARVNPDWLPSEAEIVAWHRVKDELGPALTGTPSWRRFLAFLEDELGRC